MSCTCTYSFCPRRSNCHQCIAYHRDKDPFPAGFFSSAAEKTYDRSLIMLMKDRQL